MPADQEHAASTSEHDENCWIACPHPEPPVSSAAKRSGVVKLSWWHAGGLHAHVTYPDGSWLRRTWPADQWWEIDALRFDLEREYDSVDVRP